MSLYDRLNELQRIQKREYERVVDTIAKDFSNQPRQSTPIHTDRSTMERKSSKPKENKLVRKKSNKF